MLDVAVAGVLGHRFPSEFELLIWCIAGTGQHEVDFEVVELIPGRIVHIGAGQVSRWILNSTYEALPDSTPLGDLFADFEQLLESAIPPPRSWPLGLPSCRTTAASSNA